MAHPAELPPDLRLAHVLEETALRRGPSPIGCTGHDVHFYKTEQQLTEAVVGFLADGLNAGQPLVVIATEAHRKAFHAGLRQRGLDTEELMTGREAIWLDARETLTCFMEGSIPNRDLFIETVGNVFERLLKKRYYLVVRGYGEMVDLLWRDGNTEGALLLEGLWNELADKHAFGLLCAYSLENFLNEAGVEGFRRVCAHHTHALPLESYLRAS